MIGKVMLTQLLLVATTGHFFACVAGTITWTSTSNMTRFRSRKGSVPPNPLYQRVRRQTYDRFDVFSPEEASKLLQKHNEYRALQNASNMLFMQWNYELQKLAEVYAANCNFEHSPRGYRSNAAGFKIIGENLFCTSGDKFSITGPVQNWYNEIVDYIYANSRCKAGKQCGHYTQIVWHDSYALGCSVKYCEYLRNAGRIKRGYLVVCHYGPAGNFRYTKPFKKGKPCSACNKKEYPYCVRGLCSKRPQIGSVSTCEMPQANLILLILSSSFLALKAIFTPV